MIVVSPKVSIEKYKLKTIRCPRCDRGRICDTPVVCRSQEQVSSCAKNDCIVIKCPKCGAQILLTIE